MGHENGAQKGKRLAQNQLREVEDHCIKPWVCPPQKPEAGNTTKKQDGTTQTHKRTHLFVLHMEPVICTCHMPGPGSYWEHKDLSPAGL